MNRIIKNSNSKILEKELKYLPNNTYNNRKIAQILSEEQKKYCAYTQEYISVTDTGNIDHFNPELKGANTDDYYNWFFVKDKWNKKKSNNWPGDKEILNPTAKDFEDRVIYENGYYLAKSTTDTQARNLINLLALNHPALVDKRKRYIARTHDDIKAFGEDLNTFFTTLIDMTPWSVLYLRAIKEEFSIDLWKILD